MTLYLLFVSLVQQIRLFFRKNSDISVAEDILGKRFITPTDVMCVLPGIVYPDEVLQNLHNSVPSVRFLMWCKTHNMIIVPPPPSPLSVSRLWNMFPKHFFADWVCKTDNEQPFTHHETTTSGWIAVGQKERIFDINQPVTAFDLKKDEYIPSASTAAWYILICQLRYRKDLFNKKNLLVADTSADNGKVYIGVHSTLGIGLSINPSRPSANVLIAKKIT